MNHKDEILWIHQPLRKEQLGEAEGRPRSTRGFGRSQPIIPIIRLASSNGKAAVHFTAEGQRGEWLGACFIVGRTTIPVAAPLIYGCVIQDEGGRTYMLPLYSRKGCPNDAKSGRHTD